MTHEEMTKTTEALKKGAWWKQQRQVADGWAMEESVECGGDKVGMKRARCKREREREAEMVEGRG
jgi:hypothetical protein